MNAPTLRAALCAAALLAASAASASPRLTYSGTLQDGSGHPVTGAAVLQFRFYHQAEGGTPAWEDAVAVAPDTNGWFSTILGATPLNPIDPEVFTTAVWLGIQVGTDAAELTPRMPVTSAPSAVHAAVASSVPWSGVTGAPTSFPPAAHAHAEAEVSSVGWANVTGKPASFTPAAHGHLAAEVSGKVAAAAAADGVPWSGISGRPTAFPALEHTHPWAAITSTPSVSLAYEAYAAGDGVSQSTSMGVHRFCALSFFATYGTTTAHYCVVSRNVDTGQWAVQAYALAAGAAGAAGVAQYCSAICFD